MVLFNRNRVGAVALFNVALAITYKKPAEFWVLVMM